MTMVKAYWNFASRDAAVVSISPVSACVPSIPGTRRTPSKNNGNETTDDDFFEHFRFDQQHQSKQQAQRSEPSQAIPTTSSGSSGNGNGSQPKCLQCKRAPINKKEGTCGKCDRKSYCSQACLALDRRHRRECPRLAFDYIVDRFHAVQTIGDGLLRQGRYEAADQFYRKLMAIGESSLGYRGCSEAVRTRRSPKTGVVPFCRIPPTAPCIELELLHVD